MIEHVATSPVIDQGTSILLPVPPGAAVDNLLVACVTNALQTATPPAGWTEAPGSPATVTNGVGGEGGINVLRIQVFFKILVVSDPSAFTFTWAGSGDLIGAISAFSGVDTSDPVPDGANDLSGNTTTIDADALPVISDTALLFIFYATSNGSAVLTVPGTMTELFNEVDVNAVTRAAGAIEQLGLPATTMNRPATTDNAGFGVAIMLGLNPEPIGAPPDPPEDPRDVYKSQVLRSTMPRSYDRRRTSSLSKFLSAVGESDNNLGGLFGADNFLAIDDTVAVETITRITFASANASAANAIQVNVPGNTQDDDVMLAVISKHTPTGLSAIVTPAGWTLIRTEDNDASDPGVSGITMSVYRRVASSEPANYAWTWTENDATAAGFIITYRGVDQLNVVDVDNSIQKNVDETVFSAPGVVPLGNGRMLVAFHTKDEGSRPFSTPPEMVDVGEVDINPDMALQVSDELRADTRQTEARTAVPTTFTGADGMSYLLALKPKVL